MLEVNNLDVDYRGMKALENISFRAYPGEFMVIIGPNGAGKSTLIKAILGLIERECGAVTFRDRNIKKQLHAIAYVPQRTQIDWDYPITVWNVVMMGRTMHTGWFRSHNHQSKIIVKDALERVGMLELRSRPIGELSGGQQQRVFLARALAQQADLFFFDEPFVGVDKKTETIMFDVFDELKSEGKILIVVTHDLGVTLTKCDSLLLLNKKLIANGSLQEVITSEHLQQAYGDSILLLNQIRTCI